MSEPLKLHPLARRDALWVAALALVLLAVTAAFYVREARPEWRSTQEEFRALVAERLGEDRAARVPAGVQQTWVREIALTDRCTTCHLGLSWKGLDGAPHPFRPHPAAILKAHPVERFGCTPCHGGQGWATNAREAHALDVPESDWPEPLLGEAVEKDYLLDKGALLEVRCNLCHRYDSSTPGAELVNLGKDLVRAKGCRACHVVNGRGGSVGPDLTYEGDKLAEQFNYERVSGVRSALAWQIGHLRDPKLYVTDTVMPNFHFTTREAQALALLVMSWRRASLPASYLSGAPRGDVVTAEEAAQERAMTQGEGAFLARKGCWTCHSISVFGIESPTKIGPDLSNAFADVQSRFGRTLEDFLSKPSGTMEVVLSRQIILTETERKEAIRLLTLAYERDTASRKTTAAAGAAPAGGGPAGGAGAPPRR